MKTLRLNENCMKVVMIPKINQLIMESNVVTGFLSCANWLGFFISRVMCLSE